MTKSIPISFSLIFNNIISIIELRLFKENNPRKRGSNSNLQRRKKRERIKKRRNS